MWRRLGKIVVEVEVPEGVGEGMVARFLEEAARRLQILARVVAVEPKPGLSPGEEELIKEIKRGVARRAEERIKGGAGSRH